MTIFGGGHVEASFVWRFGRRIDPEAFVFWIGLQTDRQTDRSKRL